MIPVRVKCQTVGIWVARQCEHEVELAWHGADAEAKELGGDISVTVDDDALDEVEANARELIYLSDLALEPEEWTSRQLHHRRWILCAGDLPDRGSR